MHTTTTWRDIRRRTAREVCRRREGTDLAIGKHSPIVALHGCLNEWPCHGFVHATVVGGGSKHAVGGELMVRATVAA